MKKLTFALIAITLFISGTAFGAIKAKVIELYQKDYIALINQGMGTSYIYKVDDTKNTCYVSYYEVNVGTQRSYQQALSCVKN